MRYFATTFVFALVLNHSSGALTIREMDTRRLDFDRHSLEKLKSLEEIRVFDPYAHEERVYKGWDLIALLDAIMARRFSKWRTWRSYDELSLETESNAFYKIPIAFLLEKKPYLVVERANGGEMRALDRNNNFEEVRLGRTYLVWKDSHFRQTGLFSSYQIPKKYWIREVKDIQLVDYPHMFALSGPFKASSPRSKMGFYIFRETCMTCHSINGDGKGLELNYPVNITEYFDRKRLLSYILNPRSIRWRPEMPEYRPLFGNSEDEVRSIVSYLETMVHRKRKPSEKTRLNQKDLLSH